MLKRLVLSLALFSGVVLAQTNTCAFNFNFNQNTGFTAQPSPTSFDNRLKGCNAFTLNYQASGLSAINVTLQSSAGATGPAAFGTYTGSVSSGANPSTSTSGTQAVFSGYVGWLRVLVTGTPTGSTWSITGTVYGAQSGGGPSTGSGCVGTAMTPCEVDLLNVAGNPTSVNKGNSDTGTQRVVLATDQPAVPVSSSGACGFQQSANLSTGTTIVIVTGTSMKKTGFCHLDFISDTLANVHIVEGTSMSTPCDTGTTSISPTYPMIQGAMWPFGSDELRAQTNGDDVCIVFSTSVTAGILSIYAKN